MLVISTSTIWTTQALAAVRRGTRANVMLVYYTLLLVSHLKPARFKIIVNYWNVPEKLLTRKSY